MRADRPLATNQETLVQQYFHSTFPYWEDIYSDRTVYSRIYQERARHAIAYIDRVGLSLRAPVLEIGCGPGVITVAMARRGLNVSAIDNAREMVERTRVKARQSGLESHVFAGVGNIDGLPFTDSTFELVMVIGVSEWLVSLTRPLEEIYRVLRPGGYLIISADNNWALQDIIDPLTHPALKPIKGCIGRVLRFAGLRRLRPRVRAYSLREFDRKLSDSGFEKIAGHTLGFGPFTFCKRNLLSEKAGWQLHLALQTHADSGIPLLRSAGLVYMVLAQKACTVRGDLYGP
jgi:ubiquinone/menaquinone biosynthesis C-methylase UbiE